jgi:hypothetical protein
MIKKLEEAIPRRGKGDKKWAAKARRRVYELKDKIRERDVRLEEIMSGSHDVAVSSETFPWGAKLDLHRTGAATITGKVRAGQNDLIAGVQAEMAEVADSMTEVRCMLACAVPSAWCRVRSVAWAQYKCVLGASGYRVGRLKA